MPKPKVRTHKAGRSFQVTIVTGITSLRSVIPKCLSSLDFPVSFPKSRLTMLILFLLWNLKCNCIKSFNRKISRAVTNYGVIIIICKNVSITSPVPASLW